MPDSEYIIEYGAGYLPNYHNKPDGQWEDALRDAVIRFNDEWDHWCSELWEDIPEGCYSCNRCLMCCNFWDNGSGLTAETKLELFAKYAASLGYQITRPGYEWVNCKNLQTTHIKRMKE